jgi:hypothetical protein
VTRPWPQPFRRLLRLLSSVISLGAAGLGQGADLRITEFLASNDTVFPDNADFDDYSDWIEIHNPGALPVSLDNHYLTDDLGLPTKWPFPSGASIPENGYLVIRADGFNAGPGETRVRGYYPWGSTFSTRHHHTSFKLSAVGESIGLFRLDAPPTTQTLVAKGSTWKFRDTGTDPGPNWMTAAYDDLSWGPGGAGPLGYTESWINTTVSFGADSGNKHITTYFRRTFNVADPDQISGIRLNLMADDSAVIYLNGSEVARLRLPEGEITPQQLSTSAVGGTDENVYEPIALSGFPLLIGDNLLAVEIHQQAPNSSDLAFDMEILADVIITPATELDSVTFGVQTTDVSRGRDATDAWVFYGLPSPGQANTPAPLAEPFVTSPAVTASVDSGFYGSAQIVTLTGGPAGSIRYTLDGSGPRPDSAVYSTGISVTDTTVLRARIYEDANIPGPILTRSYFLNDDATPGLPVLSFVADPETLFGDDIGIHSNDTSYVFKGREVPVRIEFFEQDQSPGFAVNAGTRIAGENIWLKPQKPFNVYLRGKYGDDVLSYQLFPGQPVADFGEFNLRNGGDDWEETLLRDAMMPAVLQSQMDAALYSYRPCILHLNGEFRGIYNIRKRFDETYFASEHRLGVGEVDFVKYAHEGSSTTRLTAEMGSTERYEALLNFLTTNDPSDPAIWAQIEEQVNIDSFIDYVVATDFARNGSWSHNREFWSSRAPGGKWQWVINDFDRGFDTANLSSSLIDDFRDRYTIFGRLDNNPGFVDRLIQRYAAHIGSTFNPQRFDDLFDALVAEQEPEVARHVARWSGSGGFSSIKRQEHIAEIKQFITDRPTPALSRLQTELGISRLMSPLTFAASPVSGGGIRIAGVPMHPDFNGTVNLFESTPVEITAEPAPGHLFVSWSNGSTDPAITITMSGALSLTANFAPGGETVVAAPISGTVTLDAVGSPYVVNGELIVEAGNTLAIDPGVTVRFTPGSSILVHGTFNANGTEIEPVQFESRSGAAWGNIGFVDTATTSTLTHVVIRDATVSSTDPSNLRAAVSGYNADVVLDHVDIEGPQPIFARFGSTTMLDSRIHITFTGDGINVKSGDAHVERCTFQGNTSVDTDAIDYDSVVDGIIRDNRIYAFRGGNSDGIDVGEGCTNLLVEQNRIYHNSDKGISVGQASDVVIRQNLIVGCSLGVAVKDAGSTATVDQNTFVRNGVGVAAYEKNRGSGGGDATVSNCIFSRSKDAPVTVDALSVLDVTYSLSDIVPILGTGNFIDDPLFTSPGIYDFSLQSLSPAIDAGDPAHATDPNGTTADIGMAYVYDPLDYPFLPPNVIVINEVLTSSPLTEGDWIELHNTGSEAVDLSGWFLSDSGSDLMKYRIADGTFLPAGGHVVFREDVHFGASSLDPGVVTPFALSANGETVYVHSPAEGLVLEYTESEDFGASEADVTFGRYYKTSSKTFNFVAMRATTPGAANSLPKIGPIVISEIMYHPSGSSSSEYIELLNISDVPVTLYDAAKGAAWAITNGIVFTFPTVSPVTMDPGERIILTRSVSSFLSDYGAPAGTQVFEWSSGGLSNAGESLELGKPGELDELLVRQYIRVDRVNYDKSSPWPAVADGFGPALERVNVFAYGNDFANWSAETASPGDPDPLANFAQWAADESLPAGMDGLTDDPDGDGLVNLVEYALGTPATSGANPPYAAVGAEGGDAVVEFYLPGIRADLVYRIEQSPSMDHGSWTSAESVIMDDTGSGIILRATVAGAGDHQFFRLLIEQR